MRHFVRLCLVGVCGIVASSTLLTAQGTRLPPAAEWKEPIRYTKGRGSVMVHLPKLPGAGDYRVFALRDGVKVTAAEGGAERVEGATIFCAGLRQSNQCDDAEAMDFGPSFRVPRCAEDVRAASVTRALAQQVQVDGLSGKTTLVVEAIDGLCPFPGAFGARHQEIGCVNDGQPLSTASYQGQSVRWETCPKTFPVRTESEIRKDYGSLIINGHGAAPKPPAGESPYKHVALPAPNRLPKVLARALLEVEPLPPNQLPAGFRAGEFFESFSAPEDAPRANHDVALVPRGFPVQAARLYETSKLALYSYAAVDGQFFLSNGTLRSVMPDIGQGIMASNVLYPRRAFPVPDATDKYLHATFETQANATQRRYFWFLACGAGVKGRTMIDGRLPAQGGIVPQPSFMDPLGAFHISTLGWNCLQLVPRGGGYGNLTGGPLKPNTQPYRPETDVRVVQNLGISRGFDPIHNADTVLNMSPAQEPYYDAKIGGTWLRAWNSQRKIAGTMLDDQMFVEQRTTFDVYFNRGRVVLYANGVQKLCNDFSQHKLTMAEAAIGIGHVLYHSSAERGEFTRNDWIRTAQYYYRYNTPFLDQRSFDNLGVQSDVGLPADFDAGRCYTSAN
ncbi:MAG TPA: hypothetical protein VJV78_40495 [Polyangiales bacterium]|nr:hypothetical protein [Polyangiales bacterium]